MKRDRTHRASRRPGRVPRRSDPPASPRSPLLIRLHAESAGLLAFRVLVVAMQAATFLITWPVWLVRTEPAMLPAWGLPGSVQFDFGYLLLASLGLVLAMPRAGLAIHFALLGLAMLFDQWRVQPEFVSMGLLMLGTLDSPGAKIVARAHLVALWFFAGFHKLFSVAYYTHVVPGQLEWLFGTGDPWPGLFDMLRGGAAVFEMSLGPLALFPRTRKWCAWLALLLHAGILQYLVVWLGGWNAAVWPWNIALAFAGFALILPWKTSPAAEWKQAGRFARGVAALILITPIGFYFGWTHPYLAHCLYSSNVPRAHIVWTDGDYLELAYLGEFPVPFPPVHSLYKAYFEKVAGPGDTLIIWDYRRLAAGRPVWTTRGEVREQRIKLPAE